MRIGAHRQPAHAPRRGHAAARRVELRARRFPGQGSRARHDAGRRDHRGHAHRHRRTRSACAGKAARPGAGAGSARSSDRARRGLRAGGWLMYYTVLAESGPAKAAIALYLVPAFAVVYGVVLLGEPLTAAAIID